MSKITFTPVNVVNSLSAINANFQKVADEMQDKIFYRENPVGEPNAVQNDLDMDGNDILNAGNVAVASLTVGGEDLTESLSAIADQVATDAANTAINAAAASVSAGQAATSATNAQASANAAAASAASIAGGPVASYNGRTGAVVSVPGDKTGLVLVKSDVGLGNVDNTSDVNKPVSTAQAAADALKANALNAALTGVPVAPTAALGTSTTQLATTAFVAAAKGKLIGVQRFTTSGAGTYTPTAGTTQAVVHLIGGGGAGGGAPATTASQHSCGTGGGAGGYTVVLYPISGSIGYVVGSGGSGVSAGIGNAGSVTSFGTSTAAGGNGGNVGAATGSPLLVGGGSGGGAGATTGGTAIMVHTGNSGEPLVHPLNWTLGINNVGNRGGAGPLGGQVTVVGPGGVGNAGFANTGCGGGGTFNGASGPNQTGGAGGSGEITVYEFT